MHPAMNRQPDDFYIAANRSAWSEAASHHADVNQQRLRNEFAQPGHYKLDDHVVRALEAADFRGKRLAQVCCNNGIDFLFGVFR